MALVMLLSQAVAGFPKGERAAAGAAWPAKVRNWPASPYVSVFETKLPPIVLGRCLPAGEATST